MFILGLRGTFVGFVPFVTRVGLISPAIFHLNNTLPGADTAALRPVHP